MILAIGDIFDFIRNGMSVKQSSDIDGLPITRIETIWNAEIDLRRVGYAGVQFSNAKDYLLKDGDILFSHINSVAHIGKCALYSEFHGELVHGMNLLCFRPNQTKILPKYALYSLRSSQFKDQLARSIKKAVNQASVTIGDIKKIQIEIPPLAEQQHIAAILDKAELVKRKREFAIEKLGSLAEAIFAEMFGDPLENEKNWQQKSLGDVLNLITYGLTVRPNYVDVGIPLISAREIRNGSVDIQNGPKISRSDYDNLSDKSKPNFGDILFSKTGSIGHCALVETKIPFAVTQNAARLSFEKSSVNTVFALNYLRFGSIQSLAQRSARGNAVKDLQLGVMKKFPFPLPPLSLQDQFAMRIAKLDQLKADSITALIKQKKLFLALEHQAFSGQL